MGNLREVRQLPLTEDYGVIINIRENKAQEVLKIFKEQEHIAYYTYYVPVNKGYSIENLDYGSLCLKESEKHRIVIQSGGKMWCGYKIFCNHLKRLAKYLENVEFLIGDEIDYIDKFSIKNGILKIERVHSGYWLPIDSFVKYQNKIQ